MNPLEIEFEVTKQDIDNSRGYRCNCGECLVAQVVKRTLNDPSVEVGLFLVKIKDNTETYRLDYRGKNLRYNFDNHGPYKIGDKFSLEQK